MAAPSDGERMATPKDDKLSSYVLQSSHYEEDFHFLTFEGLQRRNIARLQNKLAVFKTRIRRGEQLPEDDDKLQQTLHAYVDAVRDYSFTKASRPLAHDEKRDRSLRLKRFFPDLNDKVGKPFDSHYAYAAAAPGTPGTGGQHRQQQHEAGGGTDSVRALLCRLLPARLTYSAEERRARELEFSEGRPAHGVSAAVDGLARFLVAFAGGAFLLVPVIVMAIRPTLAKNLLTTCAAVVLFAAALAFGIRASDVETMVSTATYAAVLVVFVGTNSEPAPPAGLAGGGGGS